jgi:hypothetical protein
MDRTEVISSSIAEIGYDVETRTLEIAFNSGRIYQYFDVPVSLSEALTTCESKGRFFNENIRELYRWVRVR